MGLVKGIAIPVLRPIYQGFFERPLWWFLSKVKAFFFAETVERLIAIESRLTALEKTPGIGQIEASNAAQWDALEQLLLAILRQPRMMESEREASLPQREAVSRATEANKCTQ